MFRLYVNTTEAPFRAHSYTYDTYDMAHPDTQIQRQTFVTLVTKEVWKPCFVCFCFASWARKVLLSYQSLDFVYERPKAGEQKTQSL